MQVIYIFLPFILFLGLLTSYEDIKKGKIRNKWIVAALIYALLAYVAIIAFFLIKGMAINYTYFLEVSVNVIIALVVGFVGWWANLWSSGDAKLFLAYSALVPLTMYSNFYIQYFPSFVLLINTFVPFFFYASVKTLFISLREKKEFFKDIKLKEIYPLAFNLIWVMWLPRLIFSALNISLGFFLNFVIIITLMITLRKLFKKGFFVMSIALCALRLIFDYSYVTSMQFVWETGLFLITFIGIIYFIPRLASRLFISKVKIGGLKPGMILAESIYKKGTKYEKATAEKAEKMKTKIKKAKMLVGPSVEGLTIEDVKKIQKLRREKKLLFNEIMVQQTLPFAPFMFGGVLLTLLAKGSVLNLLVNFIYNALH